jgi:hypothetical protein
MIFIDGDFKSDKGNCKHHCSPTCHPCQVGPEWVYGCLHPAWPQNRESDFVPIVNCDGEKLKCELKNNKYLRSYMNGIKRRIENSKKKIESYKKLIADCKI